MIWLFEGVYDLQAVEIAGVLHVFREEDVAAGLLGGANN